MAELTAEQVERIVESYIERGESQRAVEVIEQWGKARCERLLAMLRDITDENIWTVSPQCRETVRALLIERETSDD